MLVLRRLLPQVVLDAFPQTMRQKLNLSLEVKYEGSALCLSQSSSQNVSKNPNRNVYCGGIVYHYMHQNQPPIITQEKLPVKNKKQRVNANKDTNMRKKASPSLVLQVFQPAFFYEPIEPKITQNTKKKIHRKV